MTLEEELEDILGPPPQRLCPPARPLPGVTEPDGAAPATTVAPPAPTLPWPLNLTDDELHRDEQAAAAAATPRQITFAQEVAAGFSVIDAARRAGFSTRNASPWKTAKRKDVAVLVAIIREQARRRAALTVTHQIQRFQALSRKAEQEGEFSSAIAAEVQATKLAGLFPKDDQDGARGGSTTQVFIVNTGIPPREPAPLLPGVDPYHRTLEGAPSANDAQERVPVVSTSPILGGGSSRG